jgi:hypothetical protein
VDIANDGAAALEQAAVNQSDLLVVDGSSQAVADGEQLFTR